MGQSSCWRYYGDDELNWNRTGNQQSRADFAVNEKLVNTIELTPNVGVHARGHQS